jgi:hypothetical protein
LATRSAWRSPRSPGSPASRPRPRPPPAGVPLLGRRLLQQDLQPLVPAGTGTTASKPARSPDTRLARAGIYSIDAMRDRRLLLEACVMAALWLVRRSFAG